MDPQLRALLVELYDFGRQNDAVEVDYARRMLNITPDTGELLRMLVITGSLRRVLELGTSNGYSTLWLADGCRRTGGKVITVEKSETKRTLALENFRRAGLEAWIDSRLADAGRALSDLHESDLVFLDTDRGAYVDWWPQVQAALRRGGLLVVDNATTHPHEMEPFVRAVEQTAGFSRVLVPIGNGELLILKEEA
jgi:predicted O-methyltransferase YrrM